MILKALVGEARARTETQEMTFFSFILPLSDSVDQSWPVDRIFKKLFIAAHMEKPTIIFIEDIDALTEHDIIRNAFCKEMRNISDGIFVICTTNKPQKLVDYRNVLNHFNFSLYISVPNIVDRLQMLKKLFNETVCEDFQDENFKELAMNTRG